MYTYDVENAIFTFDGDFEGYEIGILELSHRFNIMGSIYHTCQKKKIMNLSGS